MRIKEEDTGMKGQITNWKVFLQSVELIESIQIGDDLYVDKGQIKERAYEAYKNQEVIEIFY